MTLESRPPDVVKRRDELEAMLRVAVANGERWQYDEPTDEALRRVRSLLSLIAETYDDLSPFSVALGVDGGIDVTASNADFSVTIEVSPQAVLSAAAGEHGRNPVTWSGVEPSWEELVREINQAA